MPDNLKPPHPMQPVVLDERSVVRFKPNAIVQFLLDKGPFNMNQIYGELFLGGQCSQDDYSQFLQLIGYSVSGYCGLSTVSDDEKDEAEAAAAEVRAGDGEEVFSTPCCKCGRPVVHGRRFIRNGTVACSVEHLPDEDQ